MTTDVFRHTRMKQAYSGILEIAVLDALRRKIPDPNFMTTLVERFVGESERRLAEVEEAFAVGETRRIAELLHMLRGAASTIGAIQLTQTLSRYQAATEHDLLNANRAVLADIGRDLHVTRDALRAYLDSLAANLRARA